MSTISAFVDLTPEVIRATAWVVRVPGGFIGPDLRFVERVEDALQLDGHGAAANLALDVAESYRGAVVEPIIPPKENP